MEYKTRVLPVKLKSHKMVEMDGIEPPNPHTAYTPASSSSAVEKGGAGSRSLQLSKYPHHVQTILHFLPVMTPPQFRHTYLFSSLKAAMKHVPLKPSLAQGTAPAL